MKRMMRLLKLAIILLCLYGGVSVSLSQVTFEKEVKITDVALHFDGRKVSAGSLNLDDKYDYVFGPNISAHGDCLKKYKEYVFMSWYRGGEEDRRMMLSRYNTETGSLKTIEFTHRHTGHNNLWYLGESHNTIGVGVSPLDGTIHLLFDMHAYNESIPNNAFPTDYFRYAYTVNDAASVPDEEFTLDLFVKDPHDGDYNHCSLNGTLDASAYGRFTYPKFFLNDGGELFMYMRKWSSYNGGYHFSKYDAATASWSDFIKFADYHASDHGQAYDWGMYGNMKYVNGKIRVGFQRRSDNRTDRYLYQNGFYYAYSDDQSGKTNWKDHKGEPISLPVRDADVVKVSEPGDLVAGTGKDMIYMVGGFDWNVTGKGDVHIIGKVKDNENNVSKNVHTYKPADSTQFITTTDFAGGSTLYTSGNNIYIIGLNSSGRIFIEKADGGRNNFERIYEATSGRSFHHGVAYVYEGKLYYYLMEDGSGTQQSLYLHIINLGTADSGPAGYEFAAEENDTVKVEGTVDIAFGAYGNYLYLYNQTSDAVCNSTTFGGDPIPDSAKNCYIRPVVFVDGVSLNRSTLSLEPGKTARLTETISPADAKNKSVSWSSADTSIVEVDQNGLITAMALGKTFVIVNTDDGGFTDSCSISVLYEVFPNIESVDAEQLPNVASNLLDGNPIDDSRWSAETFPQSVVIDYGETLHFAGSKLYAYQNRSYHYTIAISDSANYGFVEVVNQSGEASSQPITHSFLSTSGRYVKLRVTGATGYSSVWVSINELEMIEGEAPVRVSGVTLDQTSIAIEIGDTLHLSPIVSPSDATRKDITWISADTSIAKVDSDGLVAAIAEGTTTVTVTTVDGGFTDHCMVLVNPKVTGINESVVSDSHISIYPNPAGDMLSIDFGENYDGAVKIQITNILGKLVLSGKLMGDQPRINISELTGGTYLISIYRGSEIVNRQFIKD